MRQARSSSIRRLLGDARSRRQHRDEPHKRPLTPFSPSAEVIPSAGVIPPADQPNAAHGQFWGASALLPAGKDEALASLAAKMRLRADAMSETERLWALAREAAERDRGCRSPSLLEVLANHNARTGAAGWRDASCRVS